MSRLIPTRRLVARVQKQNFFSSAASNSFSSPTAQKSQLYELQKKIIRREKYGVGQLCPAYMMS